MKPTTYHNKEVSDALNDIWPKALDLRDHNCLMLNILVHVFIFVMRLRSAYV